MERTDSSSAMMLLQYGGEDSDEDTSFNEQDRQSSSIEKKTPEARRRHSSGKGSDPQSPSRRISEDSVSRQSAGLISDEEVEHHLPDRFRKREHDKDDEEELSVPTKMFMMDVSKKMAPAVSPGDNTSNSSFPDSQRSKETKKTSKLPMRLVSYGADELEEDEEENESHEESEEEEEEDKEDEDVQESGSTSPSSKGVNMDTDTIQLPPEPQGKCSKQLQEKISNLYAKMEEEGFDTNKKIQSLTGFRNPSIYEKLIQLYHIDEKGSNFSLDVYNPHMWGKDSLYDELDKVQKKDMERREKEKSKTKIEFISGTKKSAPAADSSTTGTSDEKKRKSKWDALPAGLPSSQVQRGVFGPAPSNLTASATGTRATVISAVGTLTKKAPYNVINSTGPFNR